jgi:serine/threonine protein kinase
VQANILIDDDGRPVITDFGISSILSKASMTTRLNCESSQDHPNIMQLLLENDAELETVGGSSRSALHAASMGNDIDVGRLLLKDRIDVNAVHGYALEAAGGFDHRPPDLDISGIGVRVAMFAQGPLSLHPICVLWGGTVPAYELKPGEAHMAQIPAIVCLMLENTMDGSARKDLLCRLLTAAGSHLNAFGRTQCCHCYDPPIQLVPGYQGIEGRGVVCAASADSVHARGAYSLDLSHSNA